MPHRSRRTDSGERQEFLPERNLRQQYGKIDSERQEDDAVHDDLRQIQPVIDDQRFLKRHEIQAPDIRQLIGGYREFEQYNPCHHSQIDDGQRMSTAAPAFRVSSCLSHKSGPDSSFSCDITPLFPLSVLSFIYSFFSSP